MNRITRTSDQSQISSSIYERLKLSRPFNNEGLIGDLVLTFTNRKDGLANRLLLMHRKCLILKAFLFWQTYYH